MLTLASQLTDTLPVDATGFRPDAMQDASLDDVRRYPLLLGNRSVQAGELFAISGHPGDAHWRLEGDAHAVHRLGDGMSAGRIETAQTIGRHAGAGMRGGELSIGGSAGDWLGAEMRGGAIVVAGDAGARVGGAYHGDKLGMRGGVIHVRGAAGDELGAAMRRGMIIVEGDSGRLAGYGMRAGTILVFGTCGPLAGAGMVRGSIALFGERLDLPPTFRRACRVSPTWLGVMRQQLGVQTAGKIPAEVELYHGDLLTGGRGEILLPP